MERKVDKQGLIATVRECADIPENHKNAFIQCAEFLSQLDEDLFRFVFTYPTLYGNMDIYIEKGVLNITIEFEEHHFNWMVVDDEEWFSEKETPYCDGAFKEIVEIIKNKLCA